MMGAGNSVMLGKSYTEFEYPALVRTMTQAHTRRDTVVRQTIKLRKGTHLELVVTGIHRTSPHTGGTDWLGLVVAVHPFELI